MNDNNPWNPEFGIPLAAIAKGRDKDDVLELYMELSNRIERIMPNPRQAEDDALPRSFMISAYYTYLAGVADGMEMDEYPFSNPASIGGRHLQDTEFHALIAVIDKGRFLKEVLDQFIAIRDRAEQIAATPGKSEAEVFADTMMCAVYRIYLLGVQDGMVKESEE